MPMAFQHATGPAEVCRLIAPVCLSALFAERNTMKVLAFTGYSGSGKTTLLEKLITRLSADGVDLAVIKHTHHDIDPDTPGRDSWRHRQAGARQQRPQGEDHPVNGKGVGFWPGSGTAPDGVQRAINGIHQQQRCHNQTECPHGGHPAGVGDKLLNVALNDIAGCRNEHRTDRQRRAVCDR